MTKEQPASVVRNASEAPLQLPLDESGLSTRALLPGDSTVLPWAGRRTQRVEALIKLGRLVVLDDGIAKPSRVSRDVLRTEATEDEAVPEEDELSEEKLEMPLAETTPAGNGASAPRKAARRKKRLSGGARRALAKRTALAETTEAAQAWAANGRGPTLPAATRTRLVAEAAAEVEAARLELAARVLGWPSGRWS